MLLCEYQSWSFVFKQRIHAIAQENIHESDSGAMASPAEVSYLACHSDDVGQLRAHACEHFVTISIMHILLTIDV